MTGQSVTCYICDLEMDVENSYSVQGVHVCHSCRDDLPRCEDCGEPCIHYEDVQDNYVCRDCIDLEYLRCSICGEYCHTIDTTTDDYNTLCSSCAEDFIHCAGCGSLVRIDEVFTLGDANYCDDCFRETRDEGVIKDYCYEPSTFYKYQSGKDSLFMGVELEVESTKIPPYAAASYVRDLDPDEDHFYMKYDGSLDNGFEIVSHPCNLAYHLFKFPWEEVHQTASTSGCRSHNTRTCGIHVHLSRDFFTPLEILKFQMFVNSQRKRLEKLARRRNQSYCNYLKFKSCDLKRTYNAPTEKYTSLNTRKQHTIELRIFKGTLNSNTFFATLELCHAIANFIKVSNTYGSSVISLFDQSKTWQQFLTYVKMCKYTFLPAYLVSKGVDVVKEEDNDESNLMIIKKYRKGDKVYFKPKDELCSIMGIHDLDYNTLHQVPEPSFNTFMLSYLDKQENSEPLEILDRARQNNSYIAMFPDGDLWSVHSSWIRPAQNY